MSNLFNFQANGFKIVIMLLMFLSLIACQAGSEVTFPGSSPNNNIASPAPDAREVVNSGENIGSVEPAVPGTEPVVDPAEPVTDPVIDPVIDPIAPETDPVLDPIAPVTDPVIDPVTEPVAVPANPPRNITASVDTVTGKIIINWGTVTGASYYELWRSTVQHNKGIQIGLPTGTSSDDTTAAPGTGYWYGLKACNEAGCSGFSGQTYVIDATNIVPVAVDDSVSTETGVSVNIDVLLNDTDLTDGSIQISVFSSSMNGTTVVEADNTITYTPDAGYKGSDSFTYQVKDQNNDMATATVTIGITCPTCTAPVVSLAWNPNTDPVDGYHVYFGRTIDTANTFVKNTTTTTVQLDTQSDLLLQSGDKACFRIKSYSSVGESGFSEATCLNI